MRMQLCHAVRGHDLPHLVQARVANDEPVRPAGAQCQQQPDHERGPCEGMGGSNRSCIGHANDVVYPNRNPQVKRFQSGGISFGKRATSVGIADGDNYVGGRVRGDWGRS